MDAYEEKLFSYHLLVVTEKGVLKRIKTPFKALLLFRAGGLEENKIYLITAIFVANNGIMEYKVKGEQYHYYLFIIIG